MAYCTTTDLYSQISESDIIAITDDAGAGAINSDIVEQAIADGDAEINAHIAGRYTVPIDPVPEIIKKLSVDFAIYRLSGRRGMSIPEDRKANYNNGVALLRDIQKGDATLGVSTPDPVNTSGAVSTLTATDRTFTKTTMANF